MLDYSESSDFKNLPQEMKDHFLRLEKEMHLKAYPLRHIHGIEGFNFSRYSEGILLLPDNKSIEEIRSAEKMDEIEVEKKNIIRPYLSQFRKEMINQLLTPLGIEIKVIGFPNGMIVDIKFGSQLENNDTFLGVASSLDAAFKILNKKIEGFLEEDEMIIYNRLVSEGRMPFKGARLFIGDTIFLIKNDNKEDWSEEIVQKDVENIVKNLQELKLASDDKNKRITQLPKP